MKITFVLLGPSGRPTGGFTVMYEYANRMASRGHQVTLVHPLRWDWRIATYGLTKTKLHPLTRLHLWLGHMIRLSIVPITKSEVHWYPIDQRVKLLNVPEPKPHYFPDADAIFWYGGEDCPPQKGEQFRLIQGYGVFNEALEDALFQGSSAENSYCPLAIRARLSWCAPR